VAGWVVVQFCLVNCFFLLQSLELLNFRRVTVTGFNNGMQKVQLEQLHNLNLHNFSDIPADCFIKMMPRLTNLTTLTISTCEKALTDPVLHLIFKHLVKLESILLNKMKEVF
jgi:hypothetical protein